MAIIPGIRLEDAAETAMWAHQATPESFAHYVRQVYAEGRVYRRAPPPDPQGGTMSPFITSDSHRLNDQGVRALIGASLPTPAACAAAVDELRAALRQGITYDALWGLARHLVWGTSHPHAASGARPALPAVPAPALAAPEAALAWSDGVDWDDEAPPVLGPTLPTRDNAPATVGAPALGQPTQLSLI